MLFRSNELVVGGDESLHQLTLKIIPGDRGKIGSGWLVRSLETELRFRSKRQDSPVLLARSHVPQATEETRSKPRMRNRGELSEVVQAGFEPGRIAVAPEGKRLLLRTSTDE